MRHAKIKMRVRMPATMIPISWPLERWPAGVTVGVGRTDEDDVDDDVR